MELMVGERLYVSTWKDPPTVPQMKKFRELTVAFRRETPEGMLFANIVFGGTPAFSKAVTDETAALTAELEGWTIATAHVVLVPGLAGVAIRAFLSTIQLLSRSRTPTKVFNDVEDAAIWLSSHLQSSGTGPLVRAFRELVDSEGTGRLSPA